MYSGTLGGTLCPSKLDLHAIGFAIAGDVIPVGGVLLLPFVASRHHRQHHLLLPPPRVLLNAHIHSTYLLAAVDKAALGKHLNTPHSSHETQLEWKTGSMIGYMEDY